VEKSLVKIKKVFVVGSGFMGSGIAQTALQAGFEVILYDVSFDILEKAKTNIEYMLDKIVSKGKMTQEEKKDALNKLSLSESMLSAANVDLVIEAIIENKDAKKEVFKTLSEICDENTILATNTSSISITEIAGVVKNEKRFVGTHFFSPVPLMKLLEVIKGLGTSKETIYAIMAFGEKLGKLCILSKDSPAFIVNRMLDPMINEAIGLLEAGIGTIEDIDLGMRCGLNHPMGPLELIDMAGIDIELAVMEVLYSETGDSKYRPATLLRNMVRAGYLGKKTGKGFYVYPETGEKYPNPDLT